MNVHRTTIVVLLASGTSSNPVTHTGMALSLVCAFIGLASGQMLLDHFDSQASWGVDQILRWAQVSWLVSFSGYQTHIYVITGRSDVEASMGRLGSASIACRMDEVVSFRQP